MCAPADKREPRPDHEILDRPRDEHLAGLRGGLHPRGDVDADASDVVAASFDLAGVNARPDLQAQASNAAPEGHRAGDRTRWTVEDREQTVARALHRYRSVD